MYLVIIVTDTYISNKLQHNANDVVKEKTNLFEYLANHLVFVLSFYIADYNDFEECQIFDLSSISVIAFLEKTC